MEIMTSYKDLVRKIDILEAQLELVEAELSYWFGSGGIMFGSKGSAKFGMMAAMGNVDSIHQRKHDIIKMLEFYNEIEKEIKEKVYALEGLPFKIARMRFIQGMNYREIAESLNLSYGYVRNIASQSDKVVTTVQ